MHTMKPEKFQIVAVGRTQSRQGHRHSERHDTIYEVYVEEVSNLQVKVSGHLWWSKYTTKTTTNWKYIGYHLSHSCAMAEIVHRRVRARKAGKAGEVVDEFVL